MTETTGILKELDNAASLAKGAAQTIRDLERHVASLKNANTWHQEQRAIAEEKRETAEESADALVNLIGVFATARGAQDHFVPRPGGVVLKMSTDEAQFIYDVLYCGVAGPYTGRRALTDGIIRALRPAVNGRLDGVRPADVSGIVRFK
jgi:hypothetical protein